MGQLAEVPVEGAADAIGEEYGGAPAEVAADAGGIGRVAADVDGFAGLGEGAVDGLGRARGAADDGGDLRESQHGGTADIPDAAAGAIGRAGEQEGVDGVVYV